MIWVGSSLFLRSKQESLRSFWFLICERTRSNLLQWVVKYLHPKEIARNWSQLLRENKAQVCWLSTTLLSQWPLQEPHLNRSLTMDLSHKRNLRSYSMPLLRIPKNSSSQVVRRTPWARISYYLWRTRLNQLSSILYNRMAQKKAQVFSQSQPSMVCWTLPNLHTA